MLIVYVVLMLVALAIATLIIVSHRGLRVALSRARMPLARNVGIREQVKQRPGRTVAVPAARGTIRKPWGW